MTSSMFEIYNNSAMPHGCHIQKVATDTPMKTMCPFPYDQHALSHWKRVLYCCEKCPSIVIPRK